ncbi:MAG: hypothetical protein WBP64_01585 [Nitrososphaeraceae archaeon]
MINGCNGRDVISGGGGNEDDRLAGGPGNDVAQED